MMFVYFIVKLLFYVSLILKLMEIHCKSNVNRHLLYRLLKLRIAMVPVMTSDI